MTWQQILDIILIVYGASTLLFTFLKPDWYWNGRRMAQRRKIMGENRVSTMYYILGAFMLGVGLMGRLGYLGG